MREKQFRYLHMSWNIYGCAGQEISKIFVLS